MPGFHRAPVVAGMLLAASFVAAFVLQSPQATIAADQTVQWSVPTTSSLTISVGDTVTWGWADALPHSVTTVTAPVTFDSTVLTGTDKSFAFTFTQAGTYTYRCTIHPSGMTGTVVVEAAQSTATATASATVTATTSPAATATQPVTATPTTSAPAATTPLAGARTLTLSGGEEVPPVTTAATGSFQWKLDGQTLSYVLRANETSLTMAHIHLGDKGANGPVVAFLFGPNAAGVTSIDNAGTISTAQLVGPLAGDMAGFIAALSKGGLYVNVHSAEHPAGVLRGQIPAHTGSPGAPATGSGAANPDFQGDSYTLPLVTGTAAAIVLALLVVIALSRRRTVAR
ncbi:MAG: CHRD domain-containing protein [Dehalococcoidia bacterium]|nr:CHRD domain-containing protein [Dehalococcoidia bacterium]MCB9484613.1 CHRD domain-containing protein [Thermoflexaceae bacterium]